MFWNRKNSLLDKKIAGRRLSLWLSAIIPPIAWALLIFTFSAESALPSASYSALDFIFKKTAHMTVFAVLFWLTNRGFSLLNNSYSLKKHWYLPVFICLIYAMSDELHQHFVPDRHATFRDVGYDMLGVFTVYLYKTGRL